MTFKVSDFLEAPLESCLAHFNKDQLLEIAEHYEISISSSAAHLKDSLVATLSDGLVSKGVIAKKPDPGDWFGALGSGMTFEQGKEMFVLQKEHEKER